MNAVHITTVVATRAVALPSGGGLWAWLLFALFVVILAALLGLLLRQRRRRARDEAGRQSRHAAEGPQPGEIWWADVPYEDGTGSKDRPCLVVAVRDDRTEVLTITSRDKAGRSGWVPISRSGWARREGESWLRVDRRVPLEVERYRRYAGYCPERTWSHVRPD